MSVSGTTNRELLSSGVIVALGIGVVVLGLRYKTGTLVHMGAGYIPVVLGSLLILTGVLIGVTGWQAAEEQIRGRFPFEWRAWTCILGAVIAFVVVARYGGLIPASFLSVFVAALADRRNSLRDAVVLAGCIAVVGYVIFGWGLQLQLAAFAWG